MTELYHLTVHEAQALLAAGQISSLELTEAALERILAFDNAVKAYLTLTPELALEQAAAADRRRRAGEDAPLLGIPVAVKDVLATAAVRTTCGSAILGEFVPPESATVVRRLEAAGSVILGKTNMDEFAMGSSTENSAFFPTRNPWHLERVPGGSSGGSAAAVAASLATWAVGTDTGGSIRQPAALCGVVGLKPTYGRVSRYGLVAFGSSLDQAGPITRCVRDAALTLQVMAGHDPLDSTTAPKRVPDYAAALGRPVKGMTAGVPRQYFAAGMEPGVEAAVRQAIAHLERLGMELREVSLPHTEYALPAYYLIAPAEASANLARYDGIRYGYSDSEASELWELYRRTRRDGFGREVKRRIMLGAYALSAGYYDAYYLKAQKVRTLIRRELETAFREVDVLLTPASPTTAFRLGERTEDPLQMYLADVYTLPANLGGLCGISVPCGFSEGLPVGLQILGPGFAEETILQVAYAYEQATEWHRHRPPLAPPEELVP